MALRFFEARALVRVGKSNAATERGAQCGSARRISSAGLRYPPFYGNPSCFYLAISNPFPPHLPLFSPTSWHIYQVTPSRVFATIDTKASISTFVVSFVFGGIGAIAERPTERSFLSNYVLNPFWTWFVTLWPTWVAPNLVCICTCRPYVAVTCRRTSDSGTR